MLKPLGEVIEPDPRFATMMVPGKGGGWRPVTLADHHEMIASIRLSAAAPPDIAQMFSRGLHAALYAWFDYELTALAEQQAFASLEAALRNYYGGQKAALWPLLERAVADKLFEPDLGGVPLPAALSALRNDHAHGTVHFVTPGMALTMIAYCARLISELYPDTVQEAVQPAEGVRATNDV